MIQPASAHGNHEHRCLEDDDFYSYCTGSSGGRSHEEIELHLADCRRCREELAGLMKMLHPEPAEIPEKSQDFSSLEIEKTLELIRDDSRRMPGGSFGPAKWYRRGAAAAAVLLAVGLSSAGLLYLYEQRKSEGFCVQATSLLEGIYAPQSPSDLRLDLPFKSGGTQRELPNEENLGSAERLFNRALGVREGMREALLGLGYVHLRRNQFERAQEEFQRVLDFHSTDIQALVGRGVGRFEAGVVSTDPTARSASLGGALEDFEKVLQLKPESSEARYNEVRVLYEMGRHTRALQEIDTYLAQDTGSIWAVKLRNLKTRILMNRSEIIEREIHGAARARDAPALEALVAAAPHKIPPIIRSLLLETLATQGRSEIEGMPDSAGLQWAAEVLEASYRRTGGDRSYIRLLNFYARLSAAKRESKRGLDASLEGLIALYEKGDMASGLRDSVRLIREFDALEDYWQLVRVYQLRGTAYYYGKPDFNAATEEFLKMLEAAELSADPDLIARSLGALASSYNEQHRYDRALACLSRLKELAASHHMEGWSAFACKSIGSTCLRLNQLDESLQEYSSALALAYRLMDPQALIVSLENLGVVMERMGRHKEAAVFYGEAGESQDALLRDGTLQATPEVEARRLNLLSNQGYLALVMKDPATAEARFREALRPPLGKMRELEARNRIGLAQVLVEERRFPEAEAEVGKVLEIVSDSAFPEIAWQVHSLKGSLLKNSGDNAGALLHFQRATQILGQMRSEISSADLRQSFFARRYDPFRETVTLMFYMHQSPNRILEYADRAKSMTLREYLADRAEPRQGGLHPHTAWSRDARISEPLPPATGVLEYFVASDCLFAFFSGPHDAEVFSLRVPLSELELTVDRYLESIRTNDGNSFDGLSQSLYQMLIGPLSPKLEPGAVHTLVILPDGPLHKLPFAGLRDAGGQYLLEKFALTYAPSRSILNYCLSMNNAKGLAHENSMLLLDGTSNLKGAAQELARLAGLYPRNCRVVAGADITSLGSSVGGYEIIHFSGHASIHRGKPRLVFHDARGQIYLESSRIEDWKLKENRLVSLAGCATGVGPIFDGETPWGLVPAFLSAGAPALLVSLLPVEDILTGKLTERFYELLARGTISKASALREAQLSLLKDHASLAQHGPISWTPFIIIGDPR